MNSSSRVRLLRQSFRIVRNFSSSSASASVDVPVRKRRSLDPIIVTEAAADRIKTLISTSDTKDSIGIRLGVKRRGCNGLSYTMNYANQIDYDAGIYAKDEMMDAHGIKVFIEPMALFNVVGTTMDWVEDELTSEFTFENPNSKGECGCGESFNV